MTRYTVKAHLTEIYRRLGVDSGVQAMYVALGGSLAVAGDRPASAPALGLPTHMPLMIEGQIDSEQLMAAARLGDNEAEHSTRASLVECVDFFRHYIRPRGWGTGQSSVDSR